MSVYMELQDVSMIYKKYFGMRKIRALDKVSLKVYSQQSLGIVGPNGAGKTTLLNIMTGILSPTSGKVWRSSVKIGYIPDPPPFYENINAERNLLYFAKLDKLSEPEKKVREVIKKVGLFKWRHLTPSEFSNGMKQRLAIARALLREPELLIMDEPFSGLDPSGAIELKNLFKKIKNAGISIVLSSHNLAYVEELCDRILFINEGKIKNLKEYDKKHGNLIIYCKYPPQIRNLFDRVVFRDDGLKFEEVELEEVPHIIQELVMNGVKIYEVFFNRDRLEDEYSKIIMEVRK